MWSYTWAVRSCRDNGSAVFASGAHRGNSAQGASDMSLVTTTTTPAPSRVPSMRVLRSINPFVAAILRSPLHGLLSRRVLLLTFIGRTTGKVFTIPVGYMRERDTFTIVCSHAWWKNLRGGA